MTPINSNGNSNSYRDYEEFKKRKNNNENLMWDSIPYRNEKTNPVYRGDYFAFQFNTSIKQSNPRVEIYRIKQKLSANDRLPSWANNVGQTQSLCINFHSVHFNYRNGRLD